VGLCVHACGHTLCTWAEGKARLLEFRQKNRNQPQIQMHDLDLKSKQNLVVATFNTKKIISFSLELNSFIHFMSALD